MSMRIAVKSVSICLNYIKKQYYLKSKYYSLTFLFDSYFGFQDTHILGFKMLIKKQYYLKSKYYSLTFLFDSYFGFQDAYLRIMFCIICSLN
jgi:hypothetical protein